MIWSKIGTKKYLKVSKSYQQAYRCNRVRYREKKQCCAGCLIISPANTTKVEIPLISKSVFFPDYHIIPIIRLFRLVRPLIPNIRIIWISVIIFQFWRIYGYSILFFKIHGIILLSYYWIFFHFLLKFWWDYPIILLLKIFLFF